jgi:hypothetical protein
MAAASSAGRPAVILWSMLPPLGNLQHTVAVAGAALLALLLTLPS